MREDPIPDLDLARPDLHHVLDLQGVFADLRREHPVAWHGPKSRAGFWSVTRHADVLRVYRDTGTFTATHGMTLDSLRPDRDPAAGVMAEVTDPPEHRRLRRGVAAFFSDGAVGELEPHVDRFVATVVDDVAARSGCVDFVASVAARIPTYVAGLALGLPADDLDWVTQQTALVFLSGSDASCADLRERATAANNDLLGYFARLVRTSKQRPTGGRGLVQRLAEGTATRDGLSTGEVVLNALNLAIAGTQTTRNALTNLLMALVQFPTAYASVRADPSTVATAVEESVRWANPVRHLTRTATRDVELGGALIRSGEPVVLWHGSANRDEAVFDLPQVFDVRRHPNPHIGFATGTHSCPGSGLARLQLRTTLRHLVDRFDGVELAGPGRLVQSNFLHGYERLPVRFAPRS